MLRNLSKLCAGSLALTAAMAFSSFANAEVVEYTVPLNGSNLGESGTINADSTSDNYFTDASDIWEVVVNPDTDTVLLAIEVNSIGTSITKFEIFEVNNGDGTGSLGTAIESGGAGDQLSFSYSTTKDYYLVLTGVEGANYSVQMSAVPLPAAAWMFLSLLGGGAWLKRRRRKA